MSRIEILNTLFFPIPALWQDGHIITAPIEAVKKCCELREERWY